MAELDRSILHGEDDEAKGTVEVGDWVKHEEQLWKYEDAVTKFNQDFTILTAEEFLIAIMQQQKREPVSGMSSFPCCQSLH